MDLGYKYYLVKFAFEIPVRVKAGKTEKDDHIEAYYAARDEFCEYNTNEANIDFSELSVDDYTKRRDLVTKLHKYP